MDDHGSVDEQLLAELRLALQGVDPVPASVVDAALAAYAWRTVDAELAALSFDSLLDDKELAGVRSTSADVRMLTFDSAALTVEIAIEGERMMGQLVPPQSARVEVRQAGGSISRQADHLGRFTCENVARGPVSVICTTETGERIYTDWTIL